MGFSYEATVKVDGKDVNKLIEEFFDDKGQYEERQKAFNIAAINDALAYFNSKCNHDDGLPKEMWNFLDSIAVSMYVKGFNQAFRYYIKHEDIFNLKSNGKTE